MKWFFDEICTFDWNENQDAGYPLAQATEERVALFPQYEDWIRAYYGRWEEMLRGAIHETVALLKLLIDDPRYHVYALSNWSGETFPIALKRFEFLHWFEGIIVSGDEKTRKPFTEIYELTLNRFNLNPERVKGPNWWPRMTKRNLGLFKKPAKKIRAFKNPLKKG